MGLSSILRGLFEVPKVFGDYKSQRVTLKIYNLIRASSESALIDLNSKFATIPNRVRFCNSRSPLYAPTPQSVADFALCDSTLRRLLCALCAKRAAARIISCHALCAALHYGAPPHYGGFALCAARHYEGSVLWAALHYGDFAGRWAARYYGRLCTVSGSVLRRLRTMVSGFGRRADIARTSGDVCF